MVGAGPMGSTGTPGPVPGGSQGLPTGRGWAAASWWVRGDQARPQGAPCQVLGHSWLQGQDLKAPLGWSVCSDEIARFQ